VLEGVGIAAAPGSFVSDCTGCNGAPDATASAAKGCVDDASRPDASPFAAGVGRLEASPDWSTESGSLLLAGAGPFSVLIGPLFVGGGGCGGASRGCSL
jgi:hypothetical protein